MSNRHWPRSVRRLAPSSASALKRWRHRLPGLLAGHDSHHHDAHVEAAMGQALLRRHDPVCHLLNRMGLEEALASGRHLGSPDTHCALVELHLPHYGLLCTAFGGVEMRPLLRTLGEVLQATAGLHGLAARISEDTYVLVLPGLTGAADGQARCAELLVTIAALRMIERPGLRIWAQARLGFLPPDEVVPLTQALAALDDAVPLESRPGTPT